MEESNVSNCYTYLYDVIFFCIAFKMLHTRKNAFSLLIHVTTSEISKDV